MHVRNLGNHFLHFQFGKKTFIKNNCRSEAQSFQILQSILFNPEMLEKIRRIVKTTNIPYKS